MVRVGGVTGGLSPGVGVYTGSLGALTSVGSGATSVSLNVVAGTTYRVAVDGTAGSRGTFTLEWLLAKCNGLNATIIVNGASSGTPGNDVIVGSAQVDTIDAGAGSDTICALGGNDVITGGPNADFERGGSGNDTFHQAAAADGGDRVDGEEGADTVDYGSRTGPLTVTLNAAANDGLAGEGDTILPTVENVNGGSGADQILANASAIVNRLRGGDGGDTLVGGAGDDTLIGNPGADRLFGADGGDSMNLVDGVGHDRGDGGAGTDTASLDIGDVLISVP
jgi:Ca2+-binding RTX toxin-like protein